MPSSNMAGKAAKHDSGAQGQAFEVEDQAKGQGQGAQTPIASAAGTPVRASPRSAPVRASPFGVGTPIITPEIMRATGGIPRTQWPPPSPPASPPLSSLPQPRHAQRFFLDSDFTERFQERDPFRLITRMRSETFPTLCADLSTLLLGSSPSLPSFFPQPRGESHQTVTDSIAPCLAPITQLLLGLIGAIELLLTFVASGEAATSAVLGYATGVIQFGDMVGYLTQEHQKGSRSRNHTAFDFIANPTDEVVGSSLQRQPYSALTSGGQTVRLSLVGRMRMAWRLIVREAMILAQWRVDASHCSAMREVEKEARRRIHSTFLAVGSAEWDTEREMAERSRWARKAFVKRWIVSAYRCVAWCVIALSGPVSSLVSSLGFLLLSSILAGQRMLARAPVMRVLTGRLALEFRAYGAQARTTPFKTIAALLGLIWAIEAFCCPPPPATITQWAVRIANQSIGVGSSCGTYSPCQATGQPLLDRACGERLYSWAPEGGRCAGGSLSLKFETAVFASEVALHETSGASSAFLVELVDAVSNLTRRIHVAPSLPAVCPGFLRIPLDGQTLTKEVTVHVQLARSGGVDGVRLTGTARRAASKEAEVAAWVDFLLVDVALAARIWCLRLPSSPSALQLPQLSPPPPPSSLISSISIGGFLGRDDYLQQLRSSIMYWLQLLASFVGGIRALAGGIALAGLAATALVASGGHQLLLKPQHYQKSRRDEIERYRRRREDDGRSRRRKVNGVRRAMWFGAVRCGAVGWTDRDGMRKP